MTLAVRVIPTLLCRGRQLVKGKQFNSWRTVGMVAQAVRIHQARGVDELCMLDISATPENRGPNLDLVKELTANCFMPLTVGGGVRSIEDVRMLLAVGADKVIIGAASHHPNLLEQCADKFGSQSIVVAIDSWGTAAMKNCGRVEIGLTTLEWAQRCALAGAGEILLTSIGREGMMTGYNLECIKMVSDVVDIPVIAHGGCGSYEHMLQAIRAGASAVAVGSLFQFGDETPRGAVEYLTQHNIEVRI